MDRWATFDCYGTLIDWESGIRDVFGRLWPTEDQARLLADFHALEPIIQRDGSLSYRTVLERTLPSLAVIRGLPLHDRDTSALADALPNWPPFPEVADALLTLRRAGWKLAILSNTDADLLDASIGRLGVAIDMRIVASAIGSYKPAHRHWEEFARRAGGPGGIHMHVAASVFHDLEPCAELGIPAVWINRKHAQTDVARAAELADLRDLAPTLDRLAVGFSLRRRGRPQVR